MALCFGTGKRYLARDQPCDGGMRHVEPMKIFQNLEVVGIWGFARGTAGDAPGVMTHRACPPGKDGSSPARGWRAERASLRRSSSQMLLLW